MRTPPASRILVVACGLLAGALAQAQTAPAPMSGTAAPGRDATTLDRHTQRVERIEHEDAGSRVEELRVGGETRSISVQPKAAMPPYQVRPADPTGAGSRESGPGSAGPRVWKLHQF